MSAVTRHNLSITVYAKDREAAREMAEDLAEMAFNEPPGAEAELEGFRRGYSASGKATRIEGDPPLPAVYLLMRGSSVHLGLFSTLEGARQAMLRDAQDQADGHYVEYPSTIDQLQPWFHNMEPETSPEYTCEYYTGGERPIAYNINAMEVQA